MTSIKQLVVMLVLGIGIGPRMTSASTAAPPTCQQTWLLTSGRNLAGGTVNSTASTLGDCQAACIASPTCQSIDFAPLSVAGAGQQCWLNTAQGTSGSYTGNSHYDLTRAAATCSCAQTWLLTSGRNLVGGTVNPTATTLAACQAACIAQTTCQSIDFASGATAGNQCWLNTAQGTSGDYTGNGHYDLTRAPATCNVVATTTPAPSGSNCQQTWLATADRNLNGGTVNPTASTLAACQAACLASPTCQSIDFAPLSVAGAGQQCWLNTAQGTSGAYVGNTHYDLTRAPAGCSSTCAQTWLQINDRNLNGGTVNAAITTLAACQAACIAQPTCNSIDFAPLSVAGAGQQCWLGTGTGTSGAYVGNNHYDLTRPASTSGCSSATSPTSPGGATTPSPTSCQQTWLVTADRNLNGGTVNAAASTLAACQAACIASTTCQSIDFAPLSVAGAGQQCWLNTAQGTSGGYTGNSHYDLTRAAANCVCSFSWLQTNDRNIAGGTVNPTASTLAACQAACIASTTCQSIDFAPLSVAGAGQQCWLSNNQGTTGGYTGNNHYDLTRPAASGCPSPTPSGLCSVWYVMGGGVVNVDPATNRLVVSDNIRQLTCFNSNPCVASSLAGFNFTAPSNCISLSPYNTPGSFARFDWFKLVLQQQAGQTFPQRFVEDASFLNVQNALMPGYTSLQPVFTNPNVSYFLSALPDTTIDHVPAATVIPSQASFVLSPLQPQPNVVTTATCANVWSRIDEVVGSRNVLVGNVTRAVCRQKCLVTPYCVGVNYNYLTTTCYLETRLPNSPTVSLSFMAGYSYFELNTAYPAPCTPGNVYTFISPVSTNLVNVTTNVSTINQFQCRQNCINSESCLGINHQQGNCTQVSPGGNVTITLANYQAFVLASQFGGPCCPTQVSTFGFNDALAVLQSGITTFDACFTACSNALQCYAFDFYNNLCYFSPAPITAVSGPTLTALAGALHIDLLQSPCGAACRDKWDSYLETTATGMTLATGISSGMACRQSCQNTPTCTVVSWNYQNNTCTTGTSASVRNFPGTSPGWRTYQLFRLAYCDQDYP